MTLGGAIILGVWVVLIPVFFVGFARFLEREDPDDRWNPAAAAGWAFFWPIFVPLAVLIWAIPRLYRLAISRQKHSLL